MLRRILIPFVILAALVAVALAVGTPALHTYVEKKIATKIQAAENLPTPPSVHIGGSFLAETINGKYDALDITIPSVTRDKITLQNLALHVTNLHFSPTSSVASADAVAAHGALPVSAIAVPAGDTLTPEGDHLVLRTSVSRYGRTFPVSLPLQVQVQNDTLSLVPAGPVSTTAPVAVPVDQVTPALAHATVSLAGLPLGLHVTSVKVDGASIDFTAAASHVQLSH